MGLIVFFLEGLMRNPFLKKFQILACSGFLVSTLKPIDHKGVKVYYLALVFLRLTYSTSWTVAPNQGWQLFLNKWPISFSSKVVVRQFLWTPHLWDQTHTLPWMKYRLASPALRLTLFLANVHTFLKFSCVAMRWKGCTP